MQNCNSMTMNPHAGTYKELGLSDASELEKALADSRRAMYDGYLRHSELLYHIRTGGLYRDLGYETWDRFCEQHEQMSKRNANYMVETWDGLKDLPAADLKRISEVGLSKARLLAKVVDKENVDEWIEKANNYSCDRLYNIVRQENLNRQANEIAINRALKTEDTRDVSDEEKRMLLRFQLTDDQFELVVRALASASRVTRSESQSHNITMMAMEFVGIHGDRASFEQLMSQLERSQNLTIIAVDNETGQPIYGRDSLQEAE